MTRSVFVAGNWKMNLDRQRSVDLAVAIARHQPPAGVDVGIFPPFVYLEAVCGLVGDSPVIAGAQNMYFESHGAYTGEVSGPMLKDVGASHVILGHSERRHLFGESPEFVGKKVAAAFECGLIPILCVGETLEERESGRTQAVVFEQLSAGVAAVQPERVSQLVIAYEPVWAIGTGKTATPDQAQEVHADLRGWLSDRYNAEIAQSIRIQYGGSVKPSNAAELLSQPDIDGALVGGASLEAESFLAIVDAAPSA